MAKILCVLCDDPVGGYPNSYPRDDIPEIAHSPDGQGTPAPEHIEFRPGVLLGLVSGELGLRPYLERQGHRFVVTSDKDGRDRVFERESAVAGGNVAKRRQIKPQPEIIASGEVVDEIAPHR